MRRWGLGGLAIFVFALGACDGCTGCGDEDVVAEVLEVSGTVDRDWADRLEEWETAEAGAELSVGDGLRTGGGDSGARIELSDGGHMRLESETLVRFLESPPDRKGPGLDVATGEAVLEAGGSDLSFFTSIGGAVLEAGGSMRLLAEEGGLRYEVAIGRAQLEGTEGGPTTLTEGESMLVDIGGAILEGGEEEEPEDARHGSASHRGRHAGRARRGQRPGAGRTGARAGRAPVGTPRGGRDDHPGGQHGPGSGTRFGGADPG